MHQSKCKMQNAECRMRDLPILLVFHSVRESKLWQGGRPRPPRQYYANSYNLRMALKPGGGI